MAGNGGIPLDAKAKERLASTKEYLSQQGPAYRHHLVTPSEAVVALFPEWTGGTIPKFPTLEEVIKIGTGLNVVEGRKSPILNLVTALLGAARAYAAPVPEELCSDYQDMAPLNSREKEWSQLCCTVETVECRLELSPPRRSCVPCSFLHVSLTRPSRL